MVSEDCEKTPSDENAMSSEATRLLGQLTPSIQDLLQHFEGDKYKTAYELAREKLGSSGTVKEYQKEYRNELRNINRYLKKERTPSKDVQERFKKLMPKFGKDLKIHVNGCACWYSGKRTNCRHRSNSNVEVVIPSEKVKEFLERTKNDNLYGFSVFNERYGASGLDWKKGTNVSFEFI